MDQCYAIRKWNPKTAVLCFVLTGIALGLLLSFLGVSIKAVQGIILFSILFYASRSDIRTREVADFIPVMLVITAFIGAKLFHIGDMLAGAAAVSAPQFFMAILKPKSIGGADIKLSAACGLLLGLERGITGLVLGLFLAVVCTLWFNRIRNKKADAFPLIPYLSAGFMAAYFM